MGKKRAWFGKYSDEGADRPAMARFVAANRISKSETLPGSVTHLLPFRVGPAVPLPNGHSAPPTFTFDAPHMPTRIAVFPGVDSNFPMVVIESRLPDVDAAATFGNGWTNVNGYFPIAVTPGSKVTREDIAVAVRKAMHSLVCHEVDEWLRMDGIRVVDPHPGSGRSQQTVLDTDRRPHR